MKRNTNKHNISPIPKKIHFIWLGNKKPPYLKKFMKTFTTYAPGFSIHLWGDQDISKNNVNKEDLYLPFHVLEVMSAIDKNTQIIELWKPNIRLETTIAARGRAIATNKSRNKKGAKIAIPKTGVKFGGCGITRANTRNATKDVKDTIIVLLFFMTLFLIALSIEIYPNWI